MNLNRQTEVKPCQKADFFFPIIPIIPTQQISSPGKDLIVHIQTVHHKLSPKRLFVSYELHIISTEFVIEIAGELF